MKKLRGVIVIVVCAALCIGYYLYLSYGPNGKEKQPTEVEQLIGKDLDKSYPTTPREAIKLYNRMIVCLYNEKLEEEEFQSLLLQVRRLFDEELLSQNPEDVYVKTFEMEAKTFQKDKKKIISSTLSTSKEVVYETINDYECAYVESSYYIKGKNDSERAGQTYIMRKDSQGRWKILGYYKP